MRLALLAAIFIVQAIRGAEQKLTDTVYVPKTGIIATAPKGDLIAVARSPIPDTQVPERPDNDGSLVFIKGSKLIDPMIFHRFFSGRFITKLVWSPDGQFLVMSSESAAGHSPWHLNSYFLESRRSEVSVCRFSRWPSRLGRVCIRCASYAHGQDCCNRRRRHTGHRSSGRQDGRSSRVEATGPAPPYDSLAVIYAEY